MPHPSFLHRYPLVAYFMLTILLTWLIWFPAVILLSNGFQTPVQTSGMPMLWMTVAQTAGALMPSLVAFFLVRELEGKAASGAIFRRYKRWRTGFGWWLAAILAVPALTVGAILINVYGLNMAIPENSILGQYLYFMGPGGVAMLFPFLLATGMISSPLLEEYGWRGYALPRLQRTMPALWAALLLGLVWGVWHLPVWLAYGSDIPVYLLLIIGHCVIMTWIYNSTSGSMLMAMVVHAAMLVSLTHFSSGTSRWTEVIAVWIVVMLIVLVNGSENLSARPRFTDAG